MQKLKNWLRAATPAERDALARKAGTTLGHLRYVAGQYRSTNMKAGLARKVELAARALQKRNPDLPALLRTDLSPDCAACEYAKNCGAKK